MNIDHEIPAEPNHEITRVINLTVNELAVLKAIDNSEYGSQLGDDVWTFTIADNSELSGRTISGTISSLVKKGLVSIGNSDGNDTVGMTYEGIQQYLRAVGGNSKKDV